MKKKKLFFVMPFFYGIGGVEFIIQNRLKFLQNHFNIFVFESNSKHAKETNNNFNFEITSINNFNKSCFSVLTYIKTFRKILNNFQPDEIIVLDNGWKSLLIPYISTNIKVTYERHSPVHFISKNDGINYLFKTKLFQLLALKYNRIIFLNDAMFNNWHHPKKFVIPNGIELKKTLSIINRPLSVIWIGRLSQEKGLDHLINIWGKVSATHPDWTLKIFTPEKLNPKILQNTHKIENIIGVTNKSTIYEAGSLLVNTSNYEGFGLTILEGMNFGLPVMAFDVPDGPKYLIENNINGFLIEKNNIEDFSVKLIHLMEHENLRKVFGQSSYEKSLSFDASKVHKKWLEIYNY